MAAANASPRAQRTAILASPLSDFAGWRLALDCSDAACSGERTYAVASMVSLHGGHDTMGVTIQRLRCRVCGKPPTTIYLESGPEITARGRLRRVALLGRRMRGRGGVSDVVVVAVARRPSGLKLPACTL